MRTLSLLIALNACGNPYDTSAGSGGTSSSGDAVSRRFSFFYTSLAAMRRLSGSDDGFGGDLRFGMPTGIEGADKICQTIAQDEGFDAETWRAFLSATQGPDGRAVHAIDRIGEGPWYDRKLRLIALDQGGLIAERPQGDTDAVNDLPDESGEGTRLLGSSWDAITGSNKLGRVYFPDEPEHTCMDWTNRELEGVQVFCGHTWLVGEIGNWIQAHPERSCVQGVNLESNGAGDGSSIGSAGGWGGFYCFAVREP